MCYLCLFKEARKGFQLRARVTYTITQLLCHTLKLIPIHNKEKLLVARLHREIRELHVHASLRSTISEEPFSEELKFY